MVWIYGGAFQFGTGTLMAYDGSAFASYHDIVLVTFNYRTNGEDLCSHDRMAGIDNITSVRFSCCRRVAT